MKKLNDNTRFLIDHNKKQSQLYLSPDEVVWRNEYKRLHKTEIMVMKCMDGRVNLPLITGIPMGIITPFRNMGAKFEIGSPGFATHVRGLYEHVEKERSENGVACGIIMTSYHYSKGDHHRGCKGFGFDTAAAQEYSRNLKTELEEVYGKSHILIYPLQVGIETDEEALVLHGENDTVLYVAEESELSPGVYRQRLLQLYPDMQVQMLEDLLPLVVGNAAHVKKLRQEAKPVLELDHRENTVGAGRGFDWLHLANEAVIVGPFNIGWLDEVTVAASIVLSNLEREPELAAHGATVLVSAPFRKSGVDAMVAKKKSINMARVVWKHLKKTSAGLFTFDVDLLVGTLDRGTMLMHWLDESEIGITD